MSLREQKRLETRLRIEDAATQLVDERGFAAVTVEEICEAAGISRRTFFNYFDSKDSAVLGAPSEEFSSGQRTYFLETPTDSMLDLVSGLVKHHMTSHHASNVIAQRRRRIAADADAAAASLSRKRAKSNEIMELIKTRLENEPRLRAMPEVEPGTEAILIGGIVREALWLAAASPDVDVTAPFDQRFDASLAIIINYSKGLQW